MEDYIILVVLAVVIVGFVVWSRTRTRGDDTPPYTGTPGTTPGPGGPNRDVRKALELLTKAQIKAKAAEDFDVILSASLTKAELITEYMKLYRQS